MENCDCLNVCGDDWRVKSGDVVRCVDYDKRHPTQALMKRNAKYSIAVQMRAIDEKLRPYKHWIDGIDHVPR